jgi:hypothetical protein
MLVYDGAAQASHYYLFGDVYAAQESCDQLEILLNRLRRQQILGDQEWQRSSHYLSGLRSRLEAMIQDAA